MAQSVQLPGPTGVNIASSIVTGEMVQQINTEMDVLAGLKAPLLDYFGYANSVQLDEEWKIKWIRNEAMPVQIALQDDVDNSTTTLNIGATPGTHALSVNDAALLQVGSVFHVQPAYGSGQSEEVFYVTANDGSNVTVATRPFQGTASAHTQGDIGYLMLPSYKDTDTFPESPRIVGEFEYNYAMQTMYSWKQTDFQTARVSYLQNKQSRQARDVAAGREWALKEFSNALIYGRRRAPYNSGTQAGYFSGLREMITTNVITATGGLLTATDLMESLDSVRVRTGESQTFTLLMDTDMMRVINGVLRTYYGPTVLSQGETTADLRTFQTVRTDLGVINIMEVPQLRGEIIALSDKNDFKIHPVQVEGMGTGWVEFHRDAPYFNARMEADALSGIFTTSLGNEKRHFRITGIDPTLTNYAMAI